MGDIKLIIKELQEKSTLISFKMLDADYTEWISLNKELLSIQRKIDALSCMVTK